MLPNCSDSRRLISGDEMSKEIPTLEKVSLDNSARCSLQVKKEYGEKSARGCHSGTAAV